MAIIWETLMLRARDPVAPSYELFSLPGSRTPIAVNNTLTSIQGYKRLTSHVSRSAIFRSQSGDSRPGGEIREARQHAAASLSGEKVHGGAVIRLLVPQFPYDQLRRRSGRQRKHRSRKSGKLAGGTKSVRPPFRQLHLRGQQRSTGACPGARFQRRQSRRYAAQHGIVAVNDGLHRFAHHVRHA